MDPNVKNVFYRPDKIRSYNAFINFIVGSRGVGKTFSLTETVINDYLKTGKQFLYIRRRVTGTTPNFKIVQVLGW